MQDVLIIGVGNTLPDDGVGIRVIAELRTLDLPSEIEVVDGGVAPLGLLHVFANRRKVIAMDALRGGGDPGSIYRLSLDDVEADPHPLTPLHRVGLSETLAMATSLGFTPRQVVIFGVEPMDIGWGLELSAEVAAAVPTVVQLAREEACR